MATLRSFNPSTGDLVGEVTITPVEQIPSLISCARRAQPAWVALGVDGRRAALAPLGDAIAARVDELAVLLTREMGKPRNEARGEILSCGGKNLAAELDDMAAALAPETIADKHSRSVIYRDPFGVAAAITPWNFPFSMPHWMVLPALMAGNAVVFKPSEETPLIGQAYADLIRPLVPEGVLQIVHGDEVQGKALVAGEVDLIAFTGSREAGKTILAAASSRLTRVVLELGGKDPLLVLDDADVEAAAAFAARSSFRNAGQVCVSTERIYVADAIAERFVARLANETAKLTLGDGLDEATRIGPMINERQRDHVCQHIDDAIARGAKVVCGNAPARGNFLAPTILTDVTPEMAISRDETFGPVACVTRVHSDDEAVALANDTRFGLGAVVFGGPERAAAVARRLTAGMIGINRGVGGAHGTPWGGANESGYGFHSGRDGHRQFAQVRVITTPV
jgi:acyl-CoA reductase-like NAD-dependent aldehyde dehydrogenase